MTSCVGWTRGESPRGEASKEGGGCPFFNGLHSILSEQALPRPRIGTRQLGILKSFCQSKVFLEVDLCSPSALEGIV